MANRLDDNETTAGTAVDVADTNTWHLNALTEALGDLTLNVSDSLSVGRGSDNDVVLGSKQVSRNHALLSVLNDKLYIKDLDSSNGTFINDERIEGNKSKHIKANDTVGFASFAFQVMPPTAAADDMEPSILDTIPAAATDTQPTVSSPVEPVVEEETVIASTVTDDTDTASANKTDEPVVKETIIEDAVSSTVSSAATATTAAIKSTKTSTPTMPSKAAEQETGMSNDSAKEPLNKERVTNEPLPTEPTVHQEPSTHKNPIVTPEHDKTTKTQLQEEADPDILRAKQAATAQFSGTANLGQSRDVGTEGNNAMDQAIDNPANTGHVEKKPSGGWFIWVFIAIIIIGLSLWLFNMGSA